MEPKNLVSKTIMILLILSIISITTNPATAQIPDSFTNLKVLDSSITKPELMEKMKMMATSLGVRCEFCHKGNPAEGFMSFDFASDEKDHKKIARVMMVMTEDINKSHLAKLSNSDETSQTEVTCYTCHHSDKIPRLLKTEIETALTNGGLDSAITMYKILKEQYYGASIYDFSENSLNLIAVDLASNGQTDNAVGLLELNEKEYPQSIEVKEMFVMIYMRTGQIEEAKEAAQKVLEIDPENKKMLGLLNSLNGN